jgi:D-tyrosyl-tRNA(Tyr) deacylase
MRALIQRVLESSVTVDDNIVGQIGQGMLVLLGVGQGDTQADLDYVVRKTINLRVFDDADSKMNLSVQDIGGAMLIVSQFTLLGDSRKGNRPGFSAAAAPDVAKAMYEAFIDVVREKNINVQSGIFAADMQVQLINDGPVTLMVDSRSR